MIIFEKYIGIISVILIAMMVIMLLGYFIVWSGFLMKDLRQALNNKGVATNSSIRWSDRMFTTEEVKAITAWYKNEDTKIFHASMTKQIEKGTFMFGFEVRVPEYLWKDINKYKDYTVNFTEK